VGESLTLLPLIARLQESGTEILLTTGTVTSAALMAERLPPGAIHQYMPLDHLPWMRRFLDHWRPDLVVWAESELWPNALGEIRARAIPAVLVNARMSDKAFRGWSRWPGTARAVLAAFGTVLAQSREDARRFRALGGREVHTVGNLKLAADPLPVDLAAVAGVKDAIGQRPVWLAASIHPGEDTLAVDVHRALAGTYADLLTIIVPRHPPKAAAMAATFAAAGLDVVQRSNGAAITPATDVYIADTIGELGLFYRVCDLVVVGKSFAVGGGQNPAEPAKLGCAVICGPDMSNFRDLTAALAAAGALRQVADASALIAAMTELLAAPTVRRAQGDNGAQFMAAEGNALAETMAHVKRHLEASHLNPVD
jgi:3-deoxy-D-manno-octulosonic-acid transferase